MQFGCNQNTSSILAELPLNLQSLQIVITYKIMLQYDTQLSRIIQVLAGFTINNPLLQVSRTYNELFSNCLFPNPFRLSPHTNNKGKIIFIYNVYLNQARSKRSSTRQSPTLFRSKECFL